MGSSSGHTRPASGALPGFCFVIAKQPSGEPRAGQPLFLRSRSLGDWAVIPWTACVLLFCSCALARGLASPRTA
jgi:hypothetical protein